MFTEALFPIAKVWNQPRCPSLVEGVKQTWDTYIVDCLLLSHKERVESWPPQQNGGFRVKGDEPEGEHHCSPL
jgi:hypothetical protein